MGNIFGFRKNKGTNTARRGSITNYSVSPPPFPPSGFNFLNKNPNPFPSTAITDKGTSGMASSSGMDKKKKYGYIPDNFTSIDQVPSSSLLIFPHFYC